MTCFTGAQSHSCYHKPSHYLETPQKLIQNTNTTIYIVSELLVHIMCVVCVHTDPTHSGGGGGVGREGKRSGGREGERREGRGEEGGPESGGGDGERRGGREGEGGRRHGL